MKTHAVLFGKVKKNGEQPIKIRLYRKSQTAYIDTGFSVEPKYFDSKTGTVFKHPDDGLMIATNVALAEQIANYNKVITLLGNHINEMDITKLKNLIVSQNDAKELGMIGFSDFYEVAAKYVIELKIDGRARHGETILTTVTQIKSFSRKEENLPFSDITVDFLKRFHRWYVPSHGKQVTFNKHLRNIKLIFNEARRNKVIGREMYPFDDYNIPSDYDAEIRCLDARTVFQISQLEGFGRDMFMLTFYLCGMNMIDIVNIPYATDYIDVKRIKTIRSAKPVKLRLKLHPKAMEIIQKYQDPENKLLIKTDYPSHLHLLQQANKNLKRRAKSIGLGDISILYARHSFATIAGSLNIPDTVIDKALMHAGKGMIEKYRQFDYSIVEDAVAKVITEVFKHEEKASKPTKKNTPTAKASNPKQLTAQ